MPTNEEVLANTQRLLDRVKSEGVTDSSGNLISTSQMSPVAPITIPAPTQDTTNYPAIVAGSAQDLQAKSETAQKIVDEQNAANLKQSNDIAGMQSILGNKDTETKNLYDTTGVTASANKLADLSEQAKNVALQANIANQTLEGNASGKDVTTTFLGRQQQEVNRQAAIQTLQISQQSNIEQGNYDAAKANADAIINAKYSQIEADIKSKQIQLDALDKYSLTPAQENAKTAQQNLLTKQAQDLADKKQQEQTNSSNQLGWAKAAFDSNQPQLSSQISQLDPSSASFKQDLASLQAKINPNGSLDSQYKQMQINELAQKISDAKATSNGLSGLYGAVSPVVQLADGTYDTATQDAILSKMDPATASLVKAVGTYTMDIAKVTSLRSDQRQLLAEKVALVYPGFDMTNYATHAAYRNSLAGTAQGTTGGAINSANKVINHLTSYVDNVSKLGNTNAGGWFGSVANAGKNAIDSTISGKFATNLSEAKTDATGVKDELAKFFKGTGVADIHTIEDWSKTVDVNAPMSSQKGVVQGAIELLQGQLVPMIDQYKQTMGQEPPAGLFLKTDTQTKLSNLKNQGYKIDIPGVNYTDKNAWLKYGGGTQDQWNNAVDMLTQANLPITPDNILQAAQLNY